MASPSFNLPQSFAGKGHFADTFPLHLLPGAGKVNTRVSELSRPRLSPRDQAALKIALESSGKPRPGVTTEPSCFLGGRFR